MLNRETSQRETVASGRGLRRWHCTDRGGRRLDCFRVRSGGESVVDLALPATKSGELLGAVGVSGDTSDNDEIAALAGRRESDSTP